MADSLAQSLWNDNLDLAESILQHPFVRGIADGSLARSKFAHYVGQDTFFLEAFARAYSMAAAKAPDWDSFQTFHNLAGGVIEELGMHHDYAQRWEVDLTAIAPSKATQHYTDFLSSLAWAQDAGAIAVAMTPCMRLYAYLGQSLSQEHYRESDYSHWIHTYSDAGFESLVRELERLVESCTVPSSLARSSYRYAMECEYDFFESAWHIS